MKISKNHMLLYAVTDRTWLKGEKLKDVVEELLKAGVTCVQLREKHLDHQAFVDEAKELKTLCERYGVPLIINDNIQVAIDADADGVHIGQSDAKIQEARKLLGYDRIIGTSAHNVEEAVEAWENGADYLGCGAVFGSQTKHDVTTLDHAMLCQICQAVPLPVVAIGGINESNALELEGTGVDGIAVISALFAKENKEAATKEMCSMAYQIVNAT